MDDPPGTGSGQAAHPARVPASLGAVHAAGVAGLAFAVLLTAALLLLRQTPPEDVADFPSWWATYSPRYVVAMYLIPFAGIAFLWLLAAVRARLGDMEDRLFATVLLGSGLLFAGMLFATGAAAAAMAVSTTRAETEPEFDVFLFGRALARAFFYGFAIKMGAAFMLVASTLGRRTGFLPRWFAIAGTVAGIALLVVVTELELAALVFPAWVAILSVLLLRAHREDWSGA